MTITLHIEAADPMELQQAIKGLADTTATPAEPKKTRKKETPARATEPVDDQPALDPKEEPVETPEEPKTEAAADPDAPIPSVVDLRAVAAEKGQADPANKPKIKALLDAYESKSISTVPEDKRAAFKANLEAL